MGVNSTNFARPPSSPSPSGTGPQRGMAPVAMPVSNHPVTAPDETIKKTPVSDRASVVQSLFNGLKKFGRGFCLFGGFTSAIAAFGSYLFLGFKPLAFLLGIPSALFFYVATDLGQSVKKSQVEDVGDVFKTPIEKLNSVLQDPSKIHSDLPNVLGALKSVAKSKSTDADFEQVIMKFYDFANLIRQELDSFQIQKQIASANPEENSNSLLSVENHLEDCVQAFNASLATLRAQEPEAMKMMDSRLLARDLKGKRPASNLSI